MAAIEAANGNMFMERGGVSYFFEGRTTSGRFADEIRDRAYLEARLGEDLFKAALDADKIDLDNSGIAVIESIIRNRLRLAGKERIIRKVKTKADQQYSDEGEYQFKVFVPDVNDIPPNDLANRKVPLLAFTAKGNGAIHAMDLNGVITN